MRTTVDLDEDALIAAKQIAARERISLGRAISRLIRRGAETDSLHAPEPQPLRGRFALLPRRDEIITAEHVRTLMEREGI